MTWRCLLPFLRARPRLAPRACAPGCGAPVRRRPEHAGHADPPGPADLVAAAAAGLGCLARALAAALRTLHGRGRRRLLGRGGREIPLHPAGPLPLRRTVAPAAGYRPAPRPARRQLHPLVLAPRAAGAVERRAGAVLRADARRCGGPGAGGVRPLGRPAAHAAAVHARPSPWRFRWRCSWPWAAARRCRSIRALCTVYVELVRGVPLVSVLFMASFLFPLVPAAGHEHRRAAARAGRHYAVCRRLHGRGDPRRPAGRAARPAGSRRRAGPVLVADAAPRGAAAGAGRRAAGPDEQLHRHLQGHLAGDHRQPVRADRRPGPGAQFGRRLAPLQARGLSLHRGRSTSCSASPCRATACGWSGRSTRARPAESHVRSHHRFRQGQQVVRRQLPRAARHRPHRAARRAHRDLRPFGLGQVHADPLHQPAGGAPERPPAGGRPGAVRRRAGDRDRAPARGHGVPAVQPVPAPDRAGKPDVGAPAGAQAAAQGGRGAGTGAAGARADRRAGAQVPACSSPAASSSAWRLRARCAWRRRSCCSTSPPRRWTRRW